MMNTNLFLKPIKNMILKKVLLQSKKVTNQKMSKNGKSKIT